MQKNFHASHLIEQQHLSAEVLALIVCRLFPNVILMGGGINSLGFYYDFIFSQSLTKNMFELIEVNMYRFAKEEHPVRSISMMRENAQALFEHHHHFLLAERVAEESLNIVDLVQIGEFYGICPPLTLTHSQEMGHVRLLDSLQFSQDIDGEEVVVTRLLGISRESARDLKQFLKKYDFFLRKKDHRILGPKLNFFSFPEQMSSLTPISHKILKKSNDLSCDLHPNFSRFCEKYGLGVVWHPKGMQLRQILLNLLKNDLSQHAEEISTPVAAPQAFLGLDAQELEPFEFGGEEYRLRSSLLPQHLAFLRHISFEREELPRRVSEMTSFFRYIPESQRWGLFYQSSYFGEQTTICCLREQVVAELISSLHFIEQIITIFDFEAQWYLVASRQKLTKGRQESESLNWLKRAIETEHRLFLFSPEIQEEEGGEGARLELRIRDVMGREWPISRLGVVKPVENVHLVDQPNEKMVVLTRQVWESLDCFIALLIEHYEGKFPFWLAPEQVRVMAIGKANQNYAKQVAQRLQQVGLRVKLDLRQTKLSLRIHEAEKEHVPYLVLVGEQERVKQTISVRIAEKFNQNQSIDIETFLSKINQASLVTKSVEGKTDK